jgi:hypothetical protein
VQEWQDVYTINDIEKLFINKCENVIFTKNNNMKDQIKDKNNVDERTINM